MYKNDEITLNIVHFLVVFNDDNSDLLIPKKRFLINVIPNDNPKIVINMNGNVVMNAKRTVVDMLESLQITVLLYKLHHVVDKTSTEDASFLSISKRHAI